VFAMPTKKDILTFAIDKKLLRRLDKFREKNHIWSRSETVRRLLHEALTKHEKEESKK
jgi:metal-responsive CopG/Arc/MetJ family transcriptional regulator